MFLCLSVVLCCLVFLSISWMTKVKYTHVYTVCLPLASTGGDMGRSGGEGWGEDTCHGEGTAWLCQLSTSGSSPWLPL